MQNLKPSANALFKCFNFHQEDERLEIVAETAHVLQIFQNHLTRFEPLNKSHGLIWTNIKY